jgi:hypothetical protein
VDGLVGLLLDERARARAARDFAAADAIRDRLAALGVVVEDTPAGPRWTVSSAAAAAEPESATDAAVGGGSDGR